MIPLVPTLYFITNANGSPSATGRLMNYSKEKNTPLPAEPDQIPNDEEKLIHQNNENLDIGI